MTIIDSMSPSPGQLERQLSRQCRILQETCQDSAVITMTFYKTMSPLSGQLSPIVKQCYNNYRNHSKNLSHIVDIFKGTKMLSILLLWTPSLNFCSKLKEV